MLPSRKVRPLALAGAITLALGCPTMFSPAMAQGGGDVRPNGRAIHGQDETADLLDAYKPNGTVYPNIVKRTPGVFLAVNTQLLKLQLNPSQPGRTGQVLRYQLRFNANKLHLWKDEHKTQPVSATDPFDATAPVTTLYAEGTAISDIGQGKINREKVELLLSKDAGDYVSVDYINITIYQLKLVEIKGLYGADGQYHTGDKSGRIYNNSVYGGADTGYAPQWTKDQQYIDVTAKFEPDGIRFPSDARVVWTFQDPDDPSDNDTAVSAESKQVLDTNGDAGNDNMVAGSPPGNPAENPGWAQIGQYTLTPGQADIDHPLLTSANTVIQSGVSRVRFKVSDHGGDNFIVNAGLLDAADDDPVDGDQTGIMTVWTKINVQYARMQSAAYELPMDQVSEHFKKAFVQMDVYRDDNAVADITNTYHWADRPAETFQAMGLTDDPNNPDTGIDHPVVTAHAQSVAWTGTAPGVFTRKAPGWFFVGAADYYFPPVGSGRQIYPATDGEVGDATVVDNTTITLSAPLPVGTSPAEVIIYNYDNGQTKKVYFLTVPGLSPDRRTFHIRRNDYYEVKIPGVNPATNADPANAFYQAGLLDNSISGEVKVQVLSAGAYGYLGMSPNAGRTIVFTKWGAVEEAVVTLVHELTHAFGLFHKCGNWDYKSIHSLPAGVEDNRTRCAMNYESWFMLDDAKPSSNRRPVPWTNGNPSPDLCAQHIDAIRQSNLEDMMDLLGWLPP